MNKMTLTEMCLLSSACASTADSSLLLLEKGLIELLTHTASSQIRLHNNITCNSL